MSWGTSWLLAAVFWIACHAFSNLRPQNISGCTSRSCASSFAMQGKCNRAEISFGRLLCRTSAAQALCSLVCGREMLCAVHVSNSMASLTCQGERIQLALHSKNIYTLPRRLEGRESQCNLKPIRWNLITSTALDPRMYGR